MDIERFKKEAGKTYVYVDSRVLTAKFRGRYIEVPYSYCEFSSLSEEQQLAICQCELRKNNIEISLHELYVDDDRFFYAHKFSEFFYFIKKTLSCIESTFYGKLNTEELELIENVNESYSNFELAQVYGIVARFADNKNYLLRKRVELLEDNKNVDILCLIEAKMDCLLSEARSLNESNTLLLGEIYDLCKEAPLSEELVKLCDKFTAAISDSNDIDNRLRHRGEISALLNLANEICKDLDKEPEDSLRSNILNTMQKLGVI